MTSACNSEARRRRKLPFACLPLLLLASSSVVAVAFLCLVSEQTSWNFHLRLKTKALWQTSRSSAFVRNRRDIQPRGLQKQWILGFSSVRWPLLNHPDPILQANLINPLLIAMYLFVPFCSFGEP